VTTGGAEANDTCTDALFDGVEIIQRSPKKIPELIQSVDVLSRRANPANVRSIRLTSAYLGMSVEGGEPPRDINSEAFKIRVNIWLLSCCAIVVFAPAIGFLADVDYGRRMLKQVESLRQKESTILENLRALPPEDFEARPLSAPSPPPSETGRQTPSQNTSQYKGPFCHPDEQQVGSVPIGTGIPYRQPVTAKATDLCRQADDIGLRISLLYIGLADWNCWNYRVFPVNWLWTTITGAKLDCGAPTEQQPDGIVKAWRSHETRVSASIAVMAGFALPMMLSFLGGCAYVLREHGMKLANWTLEPHDGKNPWLRVLLAALLGGLVGVIWTSDEPVALGGFNLSLAAIAFFVGFSVEAVFRLIQTLIEGVVSTIRAPGSTAGPASPITTSQVRRIAQESATGVSQPPSLLGVEPTIAKRREAATLRVLGSNLNQVGQLQLSLGESVITATSHLQLLPCRGQNYHPRKRC
jgi:hypothetical protein